MLESMNAVPVRRLLASVLISCSLIACSDDDDKEERDEGRDLYVFGDSLSDTGNLGEFLTLNDDLPDPFYENRISNGPVIVDYVGQALGEPVEPAEYVEPGEDGTNYAVSGSKANDPDPNLTLKNQIDFFLGNNNDVVDPKDLFIIFIGGNDINSVVGQEGATAMAALDLAVEEVGAAVEDIATRGGREFFVLTVPDIGKTPDVLAAEAQTPGRAANATMLTQYYNQALRDNLVVVSDRLNATGVPGVRINVIDTFAIFNDKIARAGELGLTNTTDACYIIADFTYQPPCNESLLPNYAFFDKIHPSGRMHELVGTEVAAEIQAVLNAQ
ncbi:SGNH/GDSL hydrolase family protein [Allohahella marinimesophila]|uniref:SGNH/GDSL hydrolase family protein n=1 Tax=Allohahella marinimesophila TaxID=1054972 RepID=A0ABP7NK05_9GAMM